MTKYRINADLRPTPNFSGVRPALQPTEISTEVQADDIAQAVRNLADAAAADGYTVISVHVYARS